VKFGLYDVCSTLHGFSLPVTHNCSTLPIDRIFAPAALIPLCCTGYLNFGEGVLSNHRAIWMDIPSGLLHLCHEEPLVKAPARWLQCTDPQVVTKYNTLLHQQLMEHNVFARMQALAQSITGMCLSKAQQVEYEVLDNIAVTAKQFAERHCQKIKVGAVPWCLQVSWSINHILY